MPPSLDLIIPCFNPRLGWEKNMAAAVAEIELGVGPDVLRQVIVVNDGSIAGFSADTEAVLQAINPKFRCIFSTPNRGKGYAVRMGVAASSSELCIYTDVDLPYLNRHVVEMYQMLVRNQADVVVVSRGQSYYASVSWFRRWLSQTMKAVNRTVFGLAVSDTQGGLKGMNSAGREVFLTTTINRYLFDLEFVQKATKSGLRISTMEVILKDGIHLPSPKLGILLGEFGNLIRLLFRQ